MKHKPEGWVVLTFQTIDSKPCYVLFCSWKNDDEWRVSSGSMVLPHLSPCGNYWIWPQISGSVYELPVDEEFEVVVFNDEVDGVPLAFPDVLYGQCSFNR